jgi:selenocysteine-specific elongation factor
MNLANVARTDLARGNVVALPGQLRAAVLLDARVQLLKDVERSLTHNMQVDFYCGSQEIPARVRLLDVEELLPGESAWVQLRLSRPAVVGRRDRFILRTPSPSMTIGGGEIVDVRPRYHRRFQQVVLEALERLQQGSPEELILTALDRRVPGRGETKATAGGIGSAKTMHGLVGYELVDIVKQANMAEDVTLQILETLLSEGRVRKVGGFWFAQHIWDMLADEATRLVGEYHRLYPLRSGLSKEEWRGRLNFSPRMANEVFAELQNEGRLTMVVAGGEASGGMRYTQEGSLRTGGLLRLSDFTPRFTPAQQQLVARLLQRFRASPYTPPGRGEVEEMVGVEVLNALIEQGQLFKVGEGILFLRETYDEAVKRLVAYLRMHGKMTVAEARDILGATRKYILPLLEHMDALRITKRSGDERVLGSGASHVDGE